MGAAAEVPWTKCSPLVCVSVLKEVDICLVLFKAESSSRLEARCMSALDEPRGERRGDRSLNLPGERIGAIFAAAPIGKRGIGLVGDSECRLDLLGPLTLCGEIWAEVGTSMETGSTESSCSAFGGSWGDEIASESLTATEWEIPASRQSSRIITGSVALTDKDGPGEGDETRRGDGDRGKSGRTILVHSRTSLP